MNGNLPGSVTRISKAMVAGAAYRNGDVIGRRYRVHRVLGKGGFGLVYLVTFIEDNTVFALKTFRDEFIFEDAVKRQFEKEALIWVQLGWHPFIVQAHHVQYFDGRMFVAMDNVPGDENGLVSVHDHIIYHGKRISDHTIGSWTIQFCNGMEHAQIRGVTAHRDIKPMNLLIDTAGFLKISDFGLVASLDVSSNLSKQPVKPDHALGLLRTDGMQTCGTPGYIAPEIFRAERAGVHSDIFSYGVTMWQLAAGTTQLPYKVHYNGDLDRFTRDLYEQQIKFQIIPVRSIFWPIISTCLNPDPSRRYSNYDELRSAAKNAMKSSGIVVTDFIISKDRTSVADLINQGASYRSLGLPTEALRCYEKVLALKPDHAGALVNKGNVLSDLGMFDQAMSGYDAALRIDPKYEMAWYNRAMHLQDNGQHERAIRSLDQLIELNPLHALALSRKGFSSRACRRFDEALQCYKSALKIRPQDYRIWTDYGEAFSECGRGSEAIQCYDKAIALRADYRQAWINKARQLIVSGKNSEGMLCFSNMASIFSTNAEALNEIGNALCLVGRPAEAIPLFDAALQIMPEQAAIFWCNKGNALLDLNQEDQALQCYKKSISIDKMYIRSFIQAAKSCHRLGDLNGTSEYYVQALKIDSKNEDSWFGRGSVLLELGQNEEAILCFDNALSIVPTNTKVLYNKGVALARLKKLQQAAACLAKAVELDPQYINAWFLKSHIEKLTGNNIAAVAACEAFLKLAPPSCQDQRALVSTWIKELKYPL